MKITRICDAIAFTLLVVAIILLNSRVFDLHSRIEALESNLILQPK